MMLGLNTTSKPPKIVKLFNFARPSLLLLSTHSISFQTQVYWRRMMKMFIVFELSSPNHYFSCNQSEDQFFPRKPLFDRKLKIQSLFSIDRTKKNNLKNINFLLHLAAFGIWVLGPCYFLQQFFNFVGKLSIWKYIVSPLYVQLLPVLVEDRTGV